jgi:hypothetical protein
MSTYSLPSFKVGQIIYLIPENERKVLPAQVTEEILRRTLGGEETVWMIKLAGSQKNVPLDPNAAEYFTDVNILRDTLINRTTAQVNTMLDKTIEIANETFDVRAHKPFESISIPDSVDEQAPNITVVLPDGTKAKVRV